MQQVRETQQEKPAKEAPELFALCHDDRLMPCIFIRWQEGAEVVRPVNSQREYSFSPDRIITAAEGEAELMRRKVRGVVTNYTFTELSPEPARAVLCSHP
nr:hypothetical protein [Armatimonadota bacterium]